jgi:O-antigen/teichoic acid export membrane protein
LAADDSCPTGESNRTSLPGGHVTDSGGSLRVRAFRAMGWALGGQIGQQGARLVVTIVLSRLLVPRDFGLVAMVAALTGFAAVFTEAGVSGAVIQRVSLEKRHIEAAVWLTVVLAVTLAVITVALAPLIARFYGRPALEPLAIGFAVDFLVTAPGIVPGALLSRELRFGAIVRAELAGTIVGGTAAIIEASLRPSPWPMVTFLVVSDLLTSAILLRARPTPYRLKVGGDSIRDLWTFSGGQLGDAAVNYWSRNADNVLIGRVLGSDALGIYSRCYVILLFPVQQVAQVVNRVMFPAMSSVQDDQPRIRSAYRRTIAVIAIAVFPFTALLLVAAQPLVIGVLGRQWSAAVPVLRVFALVAAIQSIGTTTGWLYQATGHTKRMFVVTVVLTVLVIIGFVIGVQWGLMGVAYSYLAWNCISLPVNIIYSGRAVQLRLRPALADLVGPTLLSVVLGLLLLATTLALPDMPALARLAVLAAVAVVGYVAEVAVVKPVAWQHLSSALREIRPGPTLEPRGSQT